MKLGNIQKPSKLPKIGERRKMFGIWFKWTGNCWTNEYRPTKNINNA